MLRTLNIVLMAFFITAGVYVCSVAEADDMEEVIARVAAMTGLPTATPPRGGFRELPIPEIPRRYQYAWCYYEIGLERITCREGYAHLRPHEITHHLQKRAGWDLKNPDVKFVAEVQARWVQQNYFAVVALNKRFGN